ncbi:MAG: two pore domain potassium channel family protein [Sedimentisphaerales bacterium]|nr:two pore domain potassium channel family protein [Sedimentisphaerales bacterium]
MSWSYLAMRRRVHEIVAHVEAGDTARRGFDVFIVTLTTVGYGDIYPVTVLGKCMGALIAMLGIGMFALPTAILGAGFLEDLEHQKNHARCPHCGKEIAGCSPAGREHMEIQYATDRSS